MRGDELYDKWAADPQNAGKAAPNQYRMTDDVREIVSDVAERKRK